MTLTQLDLRWAIKRNGQKLTKPQIDALTKLKIESPDMWKAYASIIGGPLPWPCDGCNKPPIKHPATKCDQYWIWSGDS